MEKPNQNRWNDAAAAAVAANSAAFTGILCTGQTSDRMNRATGYYIREYYPQLRFDVGETIIRFENIKIHADFYKYIYR